MIVVLGSLNVDLVVPVERFPVAEETLLGGDYARHRGGKGANQAVAATAEPAAGPVAGALAVTVRGAQPSLPTADAIEALVQKTAA